MPDETKAFGDSDGILERQGCGRLGSGVGSVLLESRDDGAWIVGGKPGGERAGVD
jgi:hypothetical protein